MSNLIDLFLDENGKASMSRLLLFLSFFVATWILLVDTYKQGQANEGLFGIFIGAYALSYVGGAIANRKSSSQPQIVVQTGAPAEVKNADPSA